MSDPLVQEAEDLLSKLRSLQSLQHRIKQGQALHVMSVALRYTMWMRNEGIGDTYSTFCDDFGYQPEDGEDRPALYVKVQDVIRAAYGANHD
jgi:hypothetical protein